MSLPDARVLAATFAVFLTKPCPVIAEAAKVGTWTELDRLKARTHALGYFRPHVVQRLDGSFTRGSADESLFVIDPNDCVENGSFDLLLVVFPKVAVDGHDRLPRPLARFSKSAWSPLKVRLVVGPTGRGSIVFNDERPITIDRKTP